MRMRKYISPIHKKYICDICGNTVASKNAVVYACMQCAQRSTTNGVGWGVCKECQELAWEYEDEEKEEDEDDASMEQEDEENVMDKIY